MQSTMPKSRLVSALIVTAMLVVAACVAPVSWDKSDRTTNNYGADKFKPSVSGLTYTQSCANSNRPGKECTLDVYLPVAGGNRGVLVFVHGGGYKAGDKTDLLKVAGPLVMQLERGFAIVNINYRLADFPAGVFDVNDAVKFVRSNAGVGLGLNPNKVVLVGHSAGGTLVADVALAGNGVAFGQLEPVDGWVSLAGPLDLDSQTTYSFLSRVAWGAIPATTDPKRIASPTVHANRGDPRGLLIQGDLDLIVPPAHVTVFTQKAKNAGYNNFETHMVTAAPDECRNHVPACGTSIKTVNSFFDKIVRG